MIVELLSVVDFQKTPKPRNYLARREQWRLLLLVMSLGLVAVLMLEARKPENWAWIEALDRGAGRDAADSGRGEPAGRPAAASRPTDEVPGTGGRYFPGVKPAYFDSVRDDTTFRPQESDAWFHLLKILKDNDRETLEKRSSGRVTYAQLFKQSNEYRGELVTVAGNVRRAHPLEAPKNAYGIERYYRTWLQPADNTSLPIVIYCLYLPRGFPTGMKVNEEVEITGFFFKRWTYRAQNDLQTAPVLLARTVRWYQRPAVGEGLPAGPGVLLLIVGVAIAFAVLVVAYVYTRTRLTRPAGPETVPELDRLGQLDAASEAGLSLEEADDAKHDL